jgi:hypothetical protein
VLLAIGIPLTVVGGASVPDVKSATTPQRLRFGGSGVAVSF